MLGLLMIKEMTIYELGRAFKTSLALFYSASLGSLQVAVKKLLARKLIACRPARTGGRRKKVYRILEPGRAAFRAGMHVEIPPSRLEVTALSRLCFLGLLEEAEDREQVLSMIVHATGEALDGLEKLKDQLDAQAVPPSYRDIFRFQVMTLDYGIMAHRAGLAWFDSLLAQVARHV